MSRRVGLVGLAVAGLATAVAACQLLVGVEPEADTPRPPPLAEASVTDAGAPDVDPCPHARPPPPPAAPGDARRTTHVFAVRQVSFGGFTDLPRRYDFDNLCTCENRDERAPGRPRVSCVQPGEPCTATTRSDDENGADLGGENLLALGGVGLRDVEKAEVSGKFEDGRRGLLVRLDDYNEGPDDSSVVLTLVATGGVQRRAGASADAGSDADAGRDGGRDGGSDASAGQDRSRQQVCTETNDEAHKPSWDGTGRDVWFGPNTSTAALSAQAYVTGGRLVLNGTAASVRIPMFGQVLEQSRSVFVATLGRSPGGALTLRGNLVGIVSASKLLGLIGSFQNPVVGDAAPTSLCDGPLFSVLSNLICSGRDLLETGEDPSRPCDALALALGFAAEEITLGSASPACAPLAPFVCDAACPPIAAGGD